eukprot:14006037-Heterocapsa_arctica.AAC.1
MTFDCLPGMSQTVRATSCWPTSTEVTEVRTLPAKQSSGAVGCAIGAHPTLRNPVGPWERTA